jgi:Lon-like protease
VRRLLVVLLVLGLATVVVRGAVPCETLQSQPSCYVALKPGPTEDAMRLVEIDGSSAYRSSGELRLTTVAVEEELDLAGWARAVVSGSVDTVSREVLFPSTSDREEVTRQNALLMEDSQLTATLAALERLDFDIDDAFDGAQVAEVLPEATTEELEAGDVIVAVDGRPTLDSEEVVAAIAEAQPGDELVLLVRHEDDDREVEVTLGASPDDPERPFLGVLLRSYLELPVDVRIDAGVIGGPSAGLMFALSVMDLLEPDELTGGAVVAGTGTVDREGRIGAVGGVRQKVVGATSPAAGERAATVFLVPEGNLADARSVGVSRDVLLVPVATLDDALDALDDLRAGREPAGALALPERGN